MNTPVITPDSDAGFACKVFTEADEKNADMTMAPAWEQLHFLQLTAKPFENQIAVANIATPGIRFGFESYEGDFRFRGTLKSDALYLAFGGGASLKMMGRTYQQSVLSILGPGSELDAVQHSCHTRFFLTLRRPAWVSLLTGVDAERIARLWLTPGFHQPCGSEVDSRRLHQLLADLSGLTATNPALLSDPDVLRLVTDDLIIAARAVLGSAEHDSTLRSVGTAPKRRALALAAERLIQSQPDQVLSLASLCDTLHTSQRTLQLAFQEQFGIGFQAFLRIVRLNQVHSSILRSGGQLTITEIATHHGFWHLGRFAQYYQRLFGCTPSETRRRAWGLHSDGQIQMVNTPGVAEHNRLFS
jgi:AraC-like DNA-binding protein